MENNNFGATPNQSPGNGTPQRPPLRPPMPPGPGQVPTNLPRPPMPGQPLARPPIPQGNTSLTAMNRPPLPRPPMPGAILTQQGAPMRPPMPPGGPIRPPNAPLMPQPGQIAPQAVPAAPPVLPQPPLQLRPPVPSAPMMPPPMPQSAPMRPPNPSSPQAPQIAPMRPPVPSPMASFRPPLAGRPPLPSAPMRPPPQIQQHAPFQPPLQAPLRPPMPMRPPTPASPPIVGSMPLRPPSSPVMVQPRPMMPTMQPMMQAAQAPQIKQMPPFSQVPQMPQNPMQPMQSAAYQQAPMPNAPYPSSTMQPMPKAGFQQMQNQFADAPAAVNASSHQMSSLYKFEPHLIQPNIDPNHFLCTHKKAPRTSSLLSRSRLAYGVSVSFYPFGEREADKVPEVTGTIVRCKRCRTYLNPFVEMIEMGARWRCNLCFFANDFPANFDYDAVKQAPIDRGEHPELKNFVYDFSDAGSDYVARPPQPPVFLFALDVTATSVQSGFFAVACRVIQEQLDAIPNVDGRTRVAFLAFDQSLHFFKISSSPEDKAKILVVADAADPFLPASTDLLVNLAECRSQIDALLEQLPSYYASPSKSSPSFGPMLNAAHLLIKPFGGKIVAFLSNLPTAFNGALKARDDQSLLGTSKESGLLQPGNQFYKLFATDIIKDQVCVDLFLAPPKSVGYVDVATLSGLSKYTGGHVHYYPGFGGSPTDAEAVKFASDLRRFLAQEHGYEAVLRIRASKGISLSSYHGSFFLRYSDLLSVPNVNPDHSFSAQISVDEALVGPTVYFQAALLHTTCCGERRIRVVNYASPITDDLKDLLGSIDIGGVAALMPNMAVEKILANRLEDAREAVLNKCADVIGCFKSLVGLKSNPNLLLPLNLANFPLLMHALSKSAVMRGGKSVDLDSRAYLLTLIKTLAPIELMTLLLPLFYAIHSMDSQVSEKVV